MVKSRLILSPAHWESMRAHVQWCLPMEACGLLAGVGDEVQAVYTIANQEHSPSRFRMDAGEQLRAFNMMEDRGQELLGIFHSHPADVQGGPAPVLRPSHTDVQEAAYPVVQVLWSRYKGLWRAHGFWIEDGRISDVPLHITTGE